MPGENFYTAECDQKIYDICPEGDNYTEELLRAAREFRSFGKGLGFFLMSHGYTGDENNGDEKAAYLASRFRQAGIKTPRNMKRWFQEPEEGTMGGAAGASRETAYQICFAFQLSADETQDFFRRIYFKRGFDLHNEEELVYFYALNHKLSYAEARRIIERLPVIDGKGKADSEGDLCHTASILEDTEAFETAEELIAYIRENREKFGYRNVTAYEFIHKLWAEIASEEGLAIQEKRRLYDPYYPELAKEAEEDGEGAEGKTGSRETQIRQETGISRKGRKKRAEDSLWEIYRQILGLTGADVNRLGTDRSLKLVLRENELLHPFAEDCFPDRNGLTKILNREHVSYETIRKIMILLVFYKFWVSLALKKGSYFVEGGYAERWVSTADHYLTDAGYPPLYAGNPFDWIIMHASVGECPLVTFREYMRKVFYRNFDSEF